MSNRSVTFTDIIGSSNRLLRILYLYVSFCNKSYAVKVMRRASLVIMLVCVVLQNAFVMFTGLVALSGCLGYMVYLNWNVDKENTYIAIAEDDSLQRRQRKSRWD